MDLIEAINSRKSVRGYKPDPVPKEVLKEILEIATRAPSSENIQPWEFTVVAGDVLDQIRRANIEKLSAGEPIKTEVHKGPYSGKFRERMVAVGVQLFQLMNIAREDTEKKTEWRRWGFRYFDAPAVIIISVDASLGEGNQFDVGAITQTIALAALNYGLGTCIQGTAIGYTDTIRKLTGIPESKRISIGIAIGYPDWDFPANKVYSERETIDSITTWHGI